MYTRIQRPCMTCSSNKDWTLIFVKKLRTYTSAYLSGGLLYLGGEQGPIQLKWSKAGKPKTQVRTLNQHYVPQL